MWTHVPSPLPQVSAKSRNIWKAAEIDIRIPDAASPMIRCDVTKAASSQCSAATCVRNLAANLTSASAGVGEVARLSQTPRDRF